MSARSYRRYKQLCESTRTYVEGSQTLALDLSHSREAEISRLRQLLRDFSRCRRAREVHRERFIPLTDRDPGHQEQIDRLQNLERKVEELLTEAYQLQEGINLGSESETIEFSFDPPTSPCQLAIEERKETCALVKPVRVPTNPEYTSLEHEDIVEQVRESRAQRQRCRVARQRELEICPLDQQVSDSHLETDDNYQRYLDSWESCWKHERSIRDQFEAKLKSSDYQSELRKLLGELKRLLTSELEYLKRLLASSVTRNDLIRILRRRQLEELVPKLESFDLTWFDLGLIYVAKKFPLQANTQERLRTLISTIDGQHEVLLRLMTRALKTGVDYPYGQEQINADLLKSYHNVGRIGYTSHFMVGVIDEVLRYAYSLALKK